MCATWQSRQPQITINQNNFFQCIIYSFKQHGCYHDYGPWITDRCHDRTVAGFIRRWGGGGVSRPVWAIIGDFRKLISYTPHARAMALVLSVLIKTTFICMISCVYSSIFFNIYYSIHRKIIFIQLLWEVRSKEHSLHKAWFENVRSPWEESRGQNENMCGEYGGCVRFVLSENRFATVAQWPRISFATSETVSPLAMWRMVSATPAYISGLYSLKVIRGLYKWALQSQGD